MDITQTDRDKLRVAQHKLNPNFVIGNIVEHKVQDPRLYKKLSRAEQGYSTEETIELPKINYKSKYYSETNEEKAYDLTSIEENAEPTLPIDPKEAQANMWLNMDKLEIDKLEWMSSNADKLYQERIKGTTRFDKDGRVVVTKADDKNEGEETTTHDIDSLVNLLDSTYEPQVTYALNVIGKIASLATVGYYDGAFDENIHDILLKNCLLRVRHQLDSTNETILQSALKTLRSLICNTQVDEVILDRVHTLYSDNYEPNTWLFTTEEDPNEFTIDMKDSECVPIDAIATLVKRTNILQRFTNLLSVKSSEKDIITYGENILDILIRIVRHSRGYCLLVVKETPLIELMFNIFLPASVTTRHKKIRHLSVKALKLLRIIAQAGSELELRDQVLERNAIGVLIPETIIDVVTAYFFIDVNSLTMIEGEHLFKLHIESLRTVKILSKMRKFRENIKSVLAMGREKHITSIKTLASLASTDTIRSKISFDWQYAAHLIDVTGYLSKRDSYMITMNFETAIWDEYIQPILCQWLNDLVKVKVIPHLDVSIAIATAIGHHKHRMSAKSCKAVEELLINYIVTESLENPNSKANLMKVLARSAAEKSSLPEFLKNNGKLRDPQGLPSYGCLNFNTSIKHNFSFCPAFADDSPYVMLDTIMNHLIQNKSFPKETLETFINEVSISRFINCATAVHNAPINYENQVQRSISAQYEVKLICRMLLILRDYYMKEEKDPESNDHREPDEFALRRVENYSNMCHYTISVMSLINSKVGTSVELKDQLLQDILLNYNLQDRLKHESLTSHHKDYYLNAAIRSLCSLSTTSLNILQPVYLSCAHPNRYWIFQPIIEYYNGRVKPKSKDEEENRAAKVEPIAGEWFETNMNWRHLTGELAKCKDEHIIGAILEFNFTVLAHSPAYAQAVVKPNLEEYLCIIGSLFLDDDIFLKKEVSRQLAINLRTILDKCIERNNKGKFNVPFRDASRTIRPLNLPLWNFFEELVNQFEAVSYGDEGFANFLLLFMTPRSDKAFRKKLFQEKADTCLRQIRVGADGFFANPDIISEEKEKDPEMKALINRARPYVLRGSFLYCYVEHHGK